MLKFVVHVSLVLPPHFLQLFTLTPLCNKKHVLVYTFSFSMYYTHTLTPKYSFTSYGNTILINAFFMYAYLLRTGTRA